MTDLHIGTRVVGLGHPVYFIAEAGSNHDRNLEQARRLVEIAKEAGADAVKFQTFRADALYPKSAGMTDYLKVPRSIHEIIRDLEMPLEWIPELAQYCNQLGIDFLSTPFDESSADAIAPYVPAFKIASYEMTHHALVQHCARKGKPLIVSTGAAQLDEVRQMIEAARAVGCREIALMQCTAKYPAPLSTLNLRTLQTLAREFDVPVGLSDHSREALPGPMAAVALGASVLEKHFTLSNRLPGPDHAYALEPDELIEVIRNVREVERALGDGIKRPLPEEEELRHFARRSVFTTRPVAIGDRFTIDNTAVLRCGRLPHGLDPADWMRTLGHHARRDLDGESTVRSDDVDDMILSEGTVALRPLARDDTDHVVRWRSRPDVAGELFSAEPPTRAEHEVWFEQLQRRSDRLEFVIVDDGRPVGTIGLSGIDLGARKAELGILVGEPEARGHGVATVACRLLVEFGLVVLGLDQIELALFSDNATARRLYDRLGFVEDGIPTFVDKTGARRSVTRMVLRRSASWKG